MPNPRELWQSSQLLVDRSSAAPSLEATKCAGAIVQLPISLAADHPLVREVERKNKELNDYIETLETKVTLQRASAFKLIRV